MNGRHASSLGLGMAMLALAAASCSDSGSGPDTSRWRVTGGDTQRGRAAIAELQCGACHEIPGVRAARGRTGPPLEGFARRVYVAGKWPNRPNYLLSWLRDPPAMAPRTAMPAIPMDDATARDIAAYLYTLD
jgi:cytochrome c2